MTLYDSAAARIDLNWPDLIASLARTILPSSLEDLARFGGAIVNCYDVDAFSCFGGAFAWVGLSLVKYVNVFHKRAGHPSERTTPFLTKPSM